MQTLMLIAETPRGGRENHRFIVAPDCEMSERQITDLLASAEHRPESGRALLISREVSQVSGRFGREKLLITSGLLAELENSARDRVIQWLEKRLQDLDNTIAAIHWKQHSGKSIIRLRQFGGWEQDAEKLLVTLQKEQIAQTKFNQAGGRSTRSRLLFALSVAAAIIVSLFAILFAWRRADHIPPGNRDSKVDASQFQSESNKPAIENSPRERLRRELNQPEFDAIITLSPLETLQQEAELRLFLDKTITLGKFEKSRIAEFNDPIENGLLALFKELNPPLRESWQQSVKMTAKKHRRRSDEEEESFTDWKLYGKVAFVFVESLKSKAARDLFDSAKEEGVPAAIDFVVRNRAESAGTPTDLVNLKKYRYDEVSETARLLLELERFRNDLTDLSSVEGRTKCTDGVHVGDLPERSLGRRMARGVQRFSSRASGSGRSSFDYSSVRGASRCRETNAAAAICKTDTKPVGSILRPAKDGLAKRAAPPRVERPS